MSKRSRLVIILAGGESRRIGKYKALLPEEAPLIKILLRRISSPLYDIALVVKNLEQKEALGQAEVSTDKVLLDVSRRCHVIVGIFTGIVYALNRGYEYVLIVGVDQPFMSCKYACFMFNLAEKLGRGALVPRWREGLLEPLGAVYRTDRLYSAIVQSMATRKLDRCSLRMLVRILESWNDVVYVSAEHLCSLFGHVFYNVNTLQDLELVKMSVRCKT